MGSCDQRSLIAGWLQLGRNTLLGMDSEGAFQPLVALCALTKLNLSWGSFAAVPPQLAALTQLLDLDISRHVALGQFGEEGAFDALAALTSLTRLDLSYTSLETVPAALRPLRRLVVLSLSCNFAMGGGAGESLKLLTCFPLLKDLDVSRCNMPSSAFGLLVGMTECGVHLRF